MSRRLFNWTFTDVEKFLRKKGFWLGNVEGSHYYYVDSKSHIVQVPFHGSKSLKPKTLKGMIRQSGIPQDIWLDRKNKKKT
ncbi:MAG: type II toxin-antitoxin system HicA family toxin [Parcubacteria group bacterium]|nr:type II toxin-antitoxin system HicA family toxin [Parcubacteria group bacterium]